MLQWFAVYIALGNTNMRPLILCLLMLVTLIAYAKEDALSRCLRDAGGALGRPPCWEKEAVRHRSQLGNLLIELESELKTCEITLANYSVKNAVVHLKKSQQAWLMFIQHECAYVDATFGPGTDSWYAGVECEVERYKDRSEVIRTKLKAVREVKDMLRSDLPDSLNCPR